LPRPGFTSIGEQCSGRWWDHFGFDGSWGDTQVQLALGVIGQQPPGLLDQQAQLGFIAG